MSPPSLASAAATLRTALLDAVWAQWRSIGVGAAGGRLCRSIVDPEALVYASFWLEHAEPRLAKILRMWAAAGSQMMSLQRMKNLLDEYPPSVQGKLPGFAWQAITHGKDARWKQLARAPHAVREGWKIDNASPVLASPGALILRLRVGLGVGIKADVLGYLAGLAGGRATISSIAAATHYYPRAVRKAVEDMIAARFIETLATSPVTCRLRRGWLTLLELGDSPPPWCHWQELFAFGAGLDAAAAEPQLASTYLQSSRARDLMEVHAAAFFLNAVESSDPTDSPGEAYLSAFASDVARLSERIHHNFV
jgi:hypothetical protein